MHTKKAFSFVEIIITISIIALLSVIGISSMNNYNNNNNNAKVVSDVETINNALISYSQETKTLPMPGGNKNFYGSDTGYIHSYEDSETFGVYGSLTENTISKKYLDILPLDPRTNSYYAYGKTKATNQFEIASIQIINDIPTAKVTGNYSNNNGLLNLIRQYNGSNFVYDGSSDNLPYNPDELVLLVTTSDGTIYREGDTITTGTGESLEIFFSDGSVSIIKENSEITLNELNFKGKDNLNTLVKIGLGAGKIWTRATNLNDNSEFEVYTQDSAAAVRGTIFSVQNNLGSTEVAVVEGIVDVTNNQTQEETEVLKGKTMMIKGYNGNITDSISISQPPFTINIDSIEITCLNSFKYKGTCIETDQNLFKKGYELVAYAPYNEIGDLNMYTSTGKLTMSSGAIKHYGEQWNTGALDVQKSFTMTGGVRGVYIDNHNMINNNIYNNINDFIAYSGSELNLNNSFAIEMSVLGSDLKNNFIRYLFDYKDNNNYIKSFFYNYYYHYQVGSSSSSSSSNRIIFEFNYNDISDDSFYKFIFYSDNGDIGFYIDGTNFGSTGTGASIVPNNLYIGSTSSSARQWNGIIDYVKIYSK